MSIAGLFFGCFSGNIWAQRLQKIKWQLHVHIGFLWSSNTSWVPSVVPGHSLETTGHSPTATPQLFQNTHRRTRTSMGYHMDYCNISAMTNCSIYNKFKDIHRKYLLTSPATDPFIWDLLFLKEGDTTLQIETLI